MMLRETAKRLHDALLAIERLIEIVGEALHQADRPSHTELQKDLPDIRRIVAMRNRIVHGYDVIVDEVIWDAATTNVPLLIRQLTDLLQESPIPDETGMGS